MKKIIFLIVAGVMTLLSTVSAQALKDVVYLKNGSVIRGTIVEQVPNESLKITTKDGSIFICQMGDVERITKEAPAKKAIKEDVKVSYRGFVDLGYTIGVGIVSNSDRVELTTTHGVQIIPEFFVGAGVGVNYYHLAEGDTCISLPFFVDVRTDILRSNITPFVDLKIGYAFGNVQGLYVTPSVGCKVNHLDFSLGYVAQRYRGLNAGGLSLKFGVNF